MKINGIDHIAINTLDIEKSVEYFKNMFGFCETGRADMGSCILVYMHLGDICLELFDLLGETDDADTPENRKGLRHISFDVDDINEWNDDLKKKDADFAMELTRMDEIGKYGILIRTPDGVIVELNADI